MFIEIIKDAFKLMRKNTNLSTLIFLFWVLLVLITPFFGVIRMNIKAIPFIVLFFAVMCMFCSGLFYAFKKSIDYETEPPKNDTPFELPPLYFAEFFQGVGKYFTKFIFAGIFIAVLFILISVSFDYFVSHYVVIPEKFKTIISGANLLTDINMADFVNSLTQEEIIKIGKLSMFAFAVSALFEFLIMLYPVILVVKEDNFFKSFFISIKYLFKNIIVSIFMFLFFFFVIYFATIPLLNPNVASNVIILFIVVWLQCYLFTWYILSLFTYYEKVK